MKDIEDKINAETFKSLRLFKKRNNKIRMFRNDNGCTEIITELIEPITSYDVYGDFYVISPPKNVSRSKDLPTPPLPGYGGLDAFLE